jgi:acyl-CoA reductase-like NAD-dependent aldehyde dehydrogenase
MREGRDIYARAAKKLKRVALELGSKNPLIVMDDADIGLALEGILFGAFDVDYGLSSSIYTRDINKAYRAIDDLEAGITYINAPTIGTEVHLPFGGVKNTGNGAREAGSAAIAEFTEIKTVFIDYSGRLQKAQIDR